LEDAARIAAKNWRFAPARAKGQPVAATIEFPIVHVTRKDRADGKKVQPPRVVFQARPEYPFAMRASGMRGEVVVSFIVDIEGRVRNAHVVRSLNPSFDDPAIDAVRKWRFEPATADNLPVPKSMQVPIIFTLDHLSHGGKDAVTLEKKADQSKLPPELRYDTAPKLVGAVRPVYPYEALKAKRKGSATVRYIVDERGAIAHTKVIEASAPEFGAALLAAVEQFAHDPALREGRPTAAMLAFKQEFSQDEKYQMVSDLDLALLKRETSKPDSIVSARELDAPLKLISRRPPRFPGSQAGKTLKGTASIEVLVDEDGRVRLPRVVEASHDDFGYAALQGVSAWRFDPPTRGGRAVVTRVRIPIAFGEREPAAKSQ
jgi:TonB family protein